MRKRLLKQIEQTVNPHPADTAILTATVKSIVQQLLGLPIESFDPKTLKAKISTGLKARPDLALRLGKALGKAGSQPDTPNVTLADLVAAGATVEKKGGILSISI
jgi:hypothetical protein